MKTGCNWCKICPPILAILALIALAVSAKFSQLQGKLSKQDTRFRQVNKSVTGSQPKAYGSSHQHTETYYTQLIAEQCNWEAEVRTSIGTRCDLVSQQYSIEVEWPHKPYEAIGQSLHYSSELDKEPAILFLLSDQAASERAFVLARVGRIVEQYGIKVFWFDTTQDTFLPAD